MRRNGVEYKTHTNALQMKYVDVKFRFWTTSESEKELKKVPTWILNTTILKSYLTTFTTLLVIRERKTGP